MEKLCLLLALHVLWIVPSPAVPSGLQQILPLPVDSQEKGGVLGNGVTQWTTVEINGILDDDDGGLRPRIPEFGTWIGYSIMADGKWFALDFGGNKEREENAKKLIGMRVIVRGKLEERTLDGLIKQQIKVAVVSELDATDVNDSAVETINLNIMGELKHEVLERLPPVDQWSITVEGQTYSLQFSPDVPKEKPDSLAETRVFASGRLLADGMVLVTGIRAVTDR
jgi:hypothetical protein